MVARNAVRKFSAALCALFLLVYILAKIDFFTQYFQLQVEDYLRKHSVYWVAMAAIAFIIWLLGKRFPHDS